ncbi:MAG: YXWGXW repeat-containing protein [Terracidiphilus sp.]
MKKTLRFLLLALLVPLFLQSAKPASAQWYVGIHVGFGPPALPVYDLPVCPGDGYMWTPGYWAWDADDGYYWVPGTWVLAPEPGFLWTPGWWGWGDGGFFWHAGYWGPHVGFYGGINYGFGYFGDGFYGGRWQGGHFFYNSAVWRVGGGFHNVYRDDTVIHNTSIINNHISYNGGEGGIDRHPTPQEESYANERHIAPVADQTHQVDMAHSNPQLRASVNHGRPAIAATARPGEFSGHGVVKASDAGGEYHAPPAAHEGQPGGEGAHYANPAHAGDLPEHHPQQVPSTGNPDLDRKYQQQQQQLADKQNQEHQQLQQRQEQEHQQAQQQHYNQKQQQKMEQHHQQQTQQMQQRHQQQTQRMTQRQSAPRPKR